MWSTLVWVVGALAYPAFQIATSTSAWVEVARVIFEVVLYAAALVTVGLIAGCLTWRHRVDGTWPWDGYTPTSALREWAGSIGLLEHNGRPGSWASPWNRAAVLMLFVLLGLVMAMAYFAGPYSR